METEHSLIYKEDILHVRYQHLYFIDGKFVYITSKTGVTLKAINTLNGPEHTGAIDESQYSFLPTIKYVSSSDELETYVASKNVSKIDEPVLHFSHYYEHNIGHGLFDALYPIYLAYLYFHNDKQNDSFHIFVNIIYTHFWKAPSNYTATRNWVLEVFEKFCGGGILFIKNVCKYNLHFTDFIVGANKAGISCVNKYGIMPGKNMNTLEDFRERFYHVYNIAQNKVKNGINILFVHSDRTTDDERKITDELIKYYSSEYSVRFVKWKDIPSFKEQLSIMYDTDIHISGAGTSMMNFPFLKSGSVNINTGVANYDITSKEYKPSLIEVNICLLSNSIQTLFYDVYNRHIKYTELKYTIDYAIQQRKSNIFSNTIEPYYTRRWRQICESDVTMIDIIEHINNTPSQLATRFPDVWIPSYYDKKNIFQIYHDKTLIPPHVKDNLVRINPTYNYTMVNFEEGKQLIKDKFPIQIQEKIFYCIDNYPRYCHRSDLLRYCLLYLYGGVYLDVDLKALVPFDKMIKHIDIDLYTSFGLGGEPKNVNGNRVYPITSNGIMISKKHNPILLDLIQHAIDAPLLFDKHPNNRGENVCYLYQYLDALCCKNSVTFEPFKKINLKKYNIYMFNHLYENNGSYIVDKNENIIFTNDDTYKFIRQTSSYV